MFRGLILVGYVLLGVSRLIGCEVVGGLAIRKDNTLRLIIKDHLTNTRAILAPANDACASGGIAYQAQYDYYPYGKVLRKIENPRSRF